jgi:hypothetical protein
MSTPDRTSPTIHVVLRACDVVVAVNKSPRPFDLDKRTLIKICFRSLHAALQAVPHTITILGDKLSDEMQQFFKQYQVRLILGDYGNDESIRQSLQLALEFPDHDWVYICEDDYLHQENSFLEIATLIKEREVIRVGRRKHMLTRQLKYTYPDMVIFPPDYPDRYRVTTNDRYYIFHTSSLHWRQVFNTTFTMMAEVKTIRKHRQLLIKSSEHANDGYLSRQMFGRDDFSNKCICLSPMPGLTAHMHHDTLTPLNDWKRLVEKYGAQ